MWGSRLGKFIARETSKFIHWFALIFADDDAHHANPEAPTMKNFTLFVLLIMFCIAFLKIIYMMEVVVRHDLRTNSQANMQFKSIDPKTEGMKLDIQELQKEIAALQAQQNSDQANYTFSIPDIPQGWQYIFLAGMGIMAAMSATKHIANMKYGNGNGNGNGGGEDKPVVPEPTPKADGDDK